MSYLRSENRTGTERDLTGGGVCGRTAQARRPEAGLGGKGPVH